MKTLKTSVIRSVLEYLGRGATPVDGYHWVEPPSASEAKRQATDTHRPGGLSNRAISHRLFHVRMG